MIFSISPDITLIISPSIQDYCKHHSQSRYCVIIGKQVSFLKKDNSLPSSVKNRCLALTSYADYTSLRLYDNTSLTPVILALYTKESSCKWTISKDGYGSIGYGQLTPKFLDKLLIPVAPDYKRVEKQYVYATGYYLKYIHERLNPYDKWWITLQIYNGGNGVIEHCKKSNSTTWSNCLFNCNKSPSICVWKVDDNCKQYRDGCEINYEYSVKTYTYYIQYKRETDIPVQYW